MVKKRPKLDPKPAVPPFLAGEDKRSTILRAAHKLFLRDGFSVTSMDAITQEAGVSKATVYAHFDSKQILFEELLRLGSENALGMVPTLVRSGGDPRSELLAFFAPFLTILFAFNGYMWDRMVIAEAPRHPENAELFYRCTIDRITKTVEQYLTALAKEELFPARDVSLAAESLIAMVLLGPLHRVMLLGPKALDVQKTLRFGVDLLLRDAIAKLSR
jgi:AcrR family transcriptional regulator